MRHFFNETEALSFDGIGNSTTLKTDDGLLCKHESLKYAFFSGLSLKNPTPNLKKFI